MSATDKWLTRFAALDAAGQRDGADALAEEIERETDTKEPLEELT